MSDAASRQPAARAPRPEPGLFTKARFDAPCVVEVSHVFDSLHAHVEFDDDVDVAPGDEIIVHGAPVQAPYGAIVTERRVATVTKASKIERAWTRMTGDLEFMELCEFSFSGEMRP